MRRMKTRLKLLAGILLAVCLLTACGGAKEAEHSGVDGNDAQSGESGAESAGTGSAKTLGESPRLACSARTVSLAEGALRSYGRGSLIQFGDAEDAYRALMDASAELVLAEDPNAIVWAAIDDGGYAWDMTAIGIDHTAEIPVFVYAAVDMNTPEEAPARILYNWLLSDEGKELTLAEGFE